MALLELLEGVPCQVMVSGVPLDVVRASAFGAGVSVECPPCMRPGRCAHRVSCGSCFAPERLNTWGTSTSWTQLHRPPAHQVARPRAGAVR